MSDIHARIVPSAAAIGRQAWDACANPGGQDSPQPFTRYDFFAALEESGSATAQSGWNACHLVLERDSQIIGLMPLYLKSHSQGEYVFDHPWAEALERAGGDYYPKLQCAVPFTPVTGRRLLVADDLRPALLQSAKTLVGQLSASSLHITFLTRGEWQEAGGCGYLLRTDRQFHWTNDGYRDFEDFLGRLSSPKRKNLRKERASIRDAGVEFDHLTGSAITEAHWDRFYEFYIDTGNRKWGQPYLTRDFFSRIGSTMADQILLILARRGGAYIAGALNFFGDGTLYGRNWGAVEYLPFLHFETCYYQAIDFAIAHGLNKVEAGAQGAHKFLRGYMPEETYSAHYIAHPGLAKVVDAYLVQERSAIAENIEELAAQGPFKKGQ